ncbi:UDP-N-acetyl-D-galactosamine dehydrogenase [Anaerotaenia torta]|uniref:nucleotide sugar dehydrogenase n=1 Tax=Anaerotaenia torta TaxID=433293 RepID=UPI003D230135
MDLYNKIVERKAKISLIGLGYVGLPIAVAFARKAEVIGFDINKEKIRDYQKGLDPTREVGEAALKESTIQFTSEEERLREARFHIVAVPTPVNTDHTPNLRPVEEASRILGRNLTPGSIVVYESTVYPGVTQDICVPILEQASGLTCGKDFKVGYSPERINPSDRQHRLENIVKVVAGMDEESLDIIAKVYGLVIEAGIHRAPDIRTAEAAKVIENSQRDINIAFMNELSIIFHKLGLNTGEVLKAAGTKWNFLPFTPGLVGGHCIGVDPYYLTYRAEQIGYHPQVILSGRRINDTMGSYIVEQLVKKMALAGISPAEARVALLGLTFKENCPDTRNTRVMDMVKELQEYGITPVIADPQADADQVRQEHGLNLLPLEEVHGMDAVVIAVAHREFAELKEEDINSLFDPVTSHTRVLLDIKGILDRKKYEALGYQYWSL